MKGVNNAGASCAPSGSGGSPGGIGLSVQYNNGSGGFAGSPVPTGPSGVPELAYSMPVGGVGQAVAFQVPGITARSVTGSTDAIVATDRAQQIMYSNATSTAVSVPAVDTAGGDFANWVMLTYVTSGAGTITFTPTAHLINGGATFVQAVGTQCRWTSPDATNYLVSCPGSFTGVTTSGSPSASQLAGFSSSSQITNVDLTGDAATSGALATKVTGVHFGATAFPLDSSAPTNGQLLANNSGTIGGIAPGTVGKVIWACSAVNNTYTGTSPTTGTQLIACANPIPANLLQTGDIIHFQWNGEVCTSTSAGCGASAQNAGTFLIQGQLGSTVIAGSVGCDAYNVSAGAGSADEMRSYRIIMNSTSGATWASCSGFNSGGFDSTGTLHISVSGGTGTVTGGGSGNQAGGDDYATYAITGTLLPAVYLNSNAPTGSTILKGFLSVEIVRP